MGGVKNIQRMEMPLDAGADKQSARAIRVSEKVGWYR